MPNNWFTADLHLGHGNIIKYCQRPFLSDEERAQAAVDLSGSWSVSQATIRRHDAALLDAINAVVQSEDTLWILGDFCSGKIEEVQRYRSRIVCINVYLVWGNHDHCSIGPAFGKAIEQGMISVEGQDIWLNHYPMRTWNKSHHGSWQLYGHVHGRLMKEDQQEPWRLTRDVGVDACEYQPLSFSELRSYMEPRMKAFAKHQNNRISI